MTNLLRNTSMKYAKCKECKFYSKEYRGNAQCKNPLVKEYTCSDAVLRGTCGTDFSKFEPQHPHRYILRKVYLLWLKKIERWLDRKEEKEAEVSRNYVAGSWQETNEGID